MKRVPDIAGTHKPVLSVLKHSLKFDTAKALACEQRSKWKPQQMSVACTCINSNLRKQDEAHAACTYPGMNELSYSAVTPRSRALEAFCGQATRDDWNTVSDPRAGSSEADK